MSQRTLQAKLDEADFECVFDESNLFGKARHSTLSCSNQTSAWHKALPIPNLSLAILNQEFIVVVKIWLVCHPRVPPPLRHCSTVVDPMIITCLGVVTAHTESKGCPDYSDGKLMYFNL